VPDLHDLLDRAAQEFQPASSGWDEVTRRVHVRRQRRRWTSGLTAAVIAVAATAFLVQAFDRSAPHEPISPTSPLPEHLRAEVTERIAVGPGPQAIALGEGGVWVDVAPDGPWTSPQVVRLDPDSGRVVARIRVPAGESHIVPGEGSVWVTRNNRVGGRLELQTLRIDPATNVVVATLPGVGGSAAIGDGYLWALEAGSNDTTSVLAKIDPDSGSVIGTLDVGATVSDVVFGGDSLWLSTVPDPTLGNLQSKTLIQVDPSTVHVVRTLRPGAGFEDPPVFAEDALWVPLCCINDRVTLLRLDAATGQTVGTFDVGSGLPFALGLGHLLLMSERGTLSDLNPISGALELLTTSDWPAAHGTVAFDPASGSVWVSNYRHTVTRIDVRDASSAEVPQLRGLTLDRARDEIEQAGLVLGEVGRGASHESAGTVSTQSPSPSAVVGAGTAVNVTISTGLPGNALGPLDCPTSDQHAAIVYPSQQLNPGRPSSDVAQVLQNVLLGMKPSDTIDDQRSEGGSHVTIARAGRVVARIYVKSYDGMTWSAGEVATCSSSGVRLPPEG
jgi:hypothetical protein